MDVMQEHMTKGTSSNFTRGELLSLEEVQYSCKGGLYQINNNYKGNTNRYVPPNQRNNYLSYGPENTNYLVPPPGFAESHGCKPDPIQST